MRAYAEESEKPDETGGNWKEVWLERSRHALSWFRRPSKAHRQELLPNRAMAVQSRDLLRKDLGGSFQSNATGPQATASVPPIAPASPSLIYAPLSTETARAHPPWMAAALLFIAASAVSFGGLYYLRTRGK